MKLNLSLLREDRILRAFEFRVVRKMFGPERDAVTGNWRKLLNVGAS